MKRRLLIIAAVALLAIVILVVISGPVLNALGIETFCITNEDGQMQIKRCGNEPALVADTNPPTLAVDAQPVLIDTDMAVDDWLAILYLLQRPDVDVRAITVTGAGESHCEPGVQNALDLAALAGRAEIPVACGRETPLAGDRVFPQSWRDNVDALAGIEIPGNPNRPQDQGAVALISQAIREADGDLVIIALGPLTNLAELFLAEPGLAGEIQQIYVMGGAFSVPGNVSYAAEMGIENEAAEWNIYVDPRAAALVLASGAPVTFVPLDASNQVPLDNVFYERLAAERNTPEANFVYQALSQNIGFVNSGNYYFWDPLTAAVAIDESLAIFVTGSVIVIEGDGPESGATREGESGSPARWATTVDGERFTAHFLDALNGRVAE
ncbi:MAG: nucleoside hydrolase [Chloroflexota bacterium]|jgi:pyrimidine-specific ribonucleoside hydrolase